MLSWELIIREERNPLDSCPSRFHGAQFHTGYRSVFISTPHCKNWALPYATLII